MRVLNIKTCKPKLACSCLDFGSMSLRHIEEKTCLQPVEMGQSCSWTRAGLLVSGSFSVPQSEDVQEDWVKPFRVKAPQAALKQDSVHFCHINELLIILFQHEDMWNPRFNKNHHIFFSSVFRLYHLTPTCQPSNSDILISFNLNFSQKYFF